MEKQTIVPESDVSETCVSCGAKLKGKYCRKCGEKKIDPARDFSVYKFLQQNLWHFLHVDSKLLRSGAFLFTKPGFLTAEWTAGRRVAYMKPLQLFVVASLLFYFFLPTTTAYFTSERDLIDGYQERNFVLNTFHYDCGQACATKALLLQVDAETLSNRIKAEASQKSKTWLFIIIPFWGTIIYLFFKGNIPWLVPQLVFAIHGLTFYILLDLSMHAFLNILAFENLGKHILLLLLPIFSVYQGLAVRRFYGSSWPVTILKTVGIMAGFIAINLLYRQVITIWTVAAL